MRNKQRGFGGLTMYMGIILVVVIGASAAYFKYSQDQLAAANKEIAIQETRALSAEKNLEFERESVRRQQAAIDRLSDASVIIRKEQEQTIDIFANHDIQALAEAKPGLIERRVNSGTRALFVELELITDPATYKSKTGTEFVKDAE